MKRVAEGKTLTEKQKKFYRFCAEGFSPTDAAKQAGYRNAAREARRLMEKSRMQKYIEKQKESVQPGENAVAEKEEILGFLTEMMREDDDPRMRMKAAELLGKRANLFEKEAKQEKGSRIIIVDDIP